MQDLNVLIPPIKDFETFFGPFVNNIFLKKKQCSFVYSSSASFFSFFLSTYEMRVLHHSFQWETSHIWWLISFVVELVDLPFSPLCAVSRLNKASLAHLDSEWLTKPSPQLFGFAFLCKGYFTSAVCIMLLNRSLIVVLNSGWIWFAELYFTFALEIRHCEGVQSEVWMIAFI